MPISEVKNIKWKYDKKFKQWWTGETSAYANDGFTIDKESGGDRYRLRQEYFKTIGYFNKLSSAKEVARLLRHG